MESLLSASPTVCPYCKGAVPADLLRLGGNCPICMLEIPGEEAPTDPGLEARKKQEAEQRVREAAQRRKQRVLGALGAVLLAGLAVGGWKYWQHLQEPIVLEFDDVYQVDLADLPTAVQKPTEAEKPGGAGTGEKSAGRPRSPGPSVGAGSDERPSGTGANGAAQPSGTAGDLVMSTPSPAAGSAFSGGGIRIGQVDPNRATTDAALKVAQGNPDEVLTDIGAIKSMAGKVMKVYSAQVNSCYRQRLLADPSLAGVWEVRFTIRTDGSTKVSSVVGRDRSDSKLEECIGQQVTTWRFQKIAEEQPIMRKFTFRAEE